MKNGHKLLHTVFLIFGKINDRTYDRLECNVEIKCTVYEFGFKSCVGSSGEMPYFHIRNSIRNSFNRSSWFRWRLPGSPATQMRLK